MNLKHRFIGVGTVVVLLSVFTILQLQAQVPTATPVPPTLTTTLTPTSVSVTTTSTLTPTAPTPLPTRQAVVKTPLDGDSVEVVFTDNGQIATVHLANVKAPNSIGEIECFGREAAEYAVQSYQKNPLISIEPTGEIENDEVSAYITLADGTLLNEMLVLFGYAKYDGKGTGIYAEQIQAAEEQSKKGNTGLWRVCGETEQAPKPCFLFSQNEIDSGSKREFLTENPDVGELSVGFRNAYYDPIQHEIVVLWSMSISNWTSGWRMREYYRLSDCLRDRSEVFNPYE